MMQYFLTTKDTLHVGDRKGESIDVIDQLLNASNKNNEAYERISTRQVLRNFDNRKRIDRNRDSFNCLQCHSHQHEETGRSGSLFLPLRPV